MKQFFLNPEYSFKDTFSQGLKYFSFGFKKSMHPHSVSCRNQDQNKLERKMKPSGLLGAIATVLVVASEVLKTKGK